MMYPRLLNDTDSDSGWIGVKYYSLHEAVNRGDGLLTVAVAVESRRLPIGLLPT
jgi:hypothetical protein